MDSGKVGSAVVTGLHSVGVAAGVGKGAGPGHDERCTVCRQEDRAGGSIDFPGRHGEAREGVLAELGVEQERPPSLLSGVDSFVDQG